MNKSSFTVMDGILERLSLVLRKKFIKSEIERQKEKSSQCFQSQTVLQEVKEGAEALLSGEEWLRFNELENEYTRRGVKALNKRQKLEEELQRIRQVLDDRQPEEAKRMPRIRLVTDDE